MLCIDIFTTEIYVVTSGSFINLIRLLQILFKMAGIRVQYWSHASPQDWQHVVGTPIYMWKGLSVAPYALCVFLSEGSGIILFYLPAF
jgi:hypothetical protein